MRNWLVSLKPRTTSDLPMTEGSFVKAWNVIFPIIIYYTVDILVIRLGAVIVKLIATYSPERAVALGDSSSLATAIIKILAVTLAAIAVAPFFIKEKPVLLHKDSPVSWFVVSALLGVTTAIFFNLLFVITGFVGSSATYTEVAGRQHALSLPLGILIYGLITPLTEEIVFRGIVYNRMRRDYGLIIALIVAPLIFGLYHGNMVQAAYGFILGLLITWSYERYGSFLIPYIIHASANIIVYVYSNVKALSGLNMSVVCIITGVIMAFLLIFSVKRLDQKLAK